MDTLYEKIPELEIDIHTDDEPIEVTLDSENSIDILFESVSITIKRNSSNTGVDIIATDSISGSQTSSTVYDGHTPAKGVDYFTSAEIDEIKNQIFESLGEALLSVYPHAEEAYNG